MAALHNTCKQSLMCKTGGVPTHLRHDLKAVVCLIASGQSISGILRSVALQIVENMSLRQKEKVGVLTLILFDLGTAAFALHCFIFILRDLS